MADQNETRRSLGPRKGWAIRGLIALGAGCAIGLAVVVGGCSSRDPNAELTDEEGTALLKTVRDSPPRPDDLSPAEKRWLRDYLGRGKGR